MEESTRAEGEDEVPAEVPAEGSLSAVKQVLSDKRFRGFLLLFFVLVLVRNAWLCEDTFITLRVVENAINGLGLRWNPLERVQVYTHPLWMFALIPARIIGRSGAAGAMLLSLGCSIAAMAVLLFRGLANLWTAVIAVLILTLSKAFIDFSTSGLENPLSHLLLALFFIQYLGAPHEKRLSRLVLYAGLATVNRLDLAIFFVVPMAQTLWEERPDRPTLLRAAVWLAPLVLWKVFAILYYGFPFPNSYYAKLGAAPRLLLMEQGVYYLLNSLAWDPITLFTIGALVLFCATRRGDARARCLAASVVLYVLYVISVGGDYMTGRLLTPALFVAVLSLSKMELAPGLELYGGVALLGLIGLTAPRPPIFSSDKYETIPSTLQHIDDERGFRHHDTSLLLRNRERGLKGLSGWVKDGIDARERGDKIVVYKNVGYFGFFAGPNVHIIDPYGIGDPLMPRLPFRGGEWATGHFHRNVPDGYLDAALDAGAIKDPELEAYWQKLKRVSRDPIFDGARLREVFRFTIGANPSRAPIAH